MRFLWQQLKWADQKKYDAIICLGAVIRGATTHYDYVCAEVSKGIAAVSLDAKVPVMFGILTTETIEQAIERAGTKAGNKGFDVPLAQLRWQIFARVWNNRWVTGANPGSWPFRPCLPWI